MLTAFRLVFGLLLLTSLGLVIASYVKREPRYRVLGVRVLGWTVAAGLGFFAVLFVQRLAGG